MLETENCHCLLPRHSSANSGWSGCSLTKIYASICKKWRKKAYTTYNGKNTYSHYKKIYFILGFYHMLTFIYPWKWVQLCTCSTFIDANINKLHVSIVTQYIWSHCKHSTWNDSNFASINRWLFTSLHTGQTMFLILTLKVKNVKLEDKHFFFI